MTPTGRFSLIALIAVLLAAVVSRLPIIAIGPIQPNLVLAVLIACALFTRNTAFFAALVGVATLFARPTPFLFDSVSLGIAVAAFVAFAIKQRVVWPDRLGVVIFALLGTVVTYVVAAPRFIIHHPGLLFLEVAVNIMCSIVCFELFALVAGRRHE